MSFQANPVQLRRFNNLNRSGEDGKWEPGRGLSRDEYYQRRRNADASVIRFLLSEHKVKELEGL